MTKIIDEFDTVWAPPGKAVDGNGVIYENVQDAVDASSGLVLIGPGTFNESVHIPRTAENAGMEIRGIGQAARIDGGTDGHAIHIEADEVTVSSLTVRTEPGVGNSFNGLHISHSTDSIVEPRLSNVTVEESDNHGVEINAGVGGWFSECNIEAADNHGMRINAQRLMINTCYFGNTADSVSGNAVVFPGERCKIDNSYIFRVSGDGVVVSGNDNTITDTTMQSVGGTGILDSGTSNLYDGNRIGGSGTADIDNSTATSPMNGDNLTGTFT